MAALARRNAFDPTGRRHGSCPRLRRAIAPLRSRLTLPAGSRSLAWGCRFGAAELHTAGAPLLSKMIWECEPLEPRQEVLANGARTVLGAKWPVGIEDTMLRYMPLTAGAIYIKRKGAIPGKNDTAGAASQWAVWVNGRNGWDEFGERNVFLHELMHHYEFRLRLACWQENQDIDGFILHGSWLLAYEADMLFLEAHGLPLRERSLSEYSEQRQAQESLADFAEEYFMPEALSQGARQVIFDGNKQVNGYREIEQYAPNRYAYFEQLVFQRYIDEKRWRRKYPDGGEWPGTCRPPTLDKPAGILESITKSSSAPGYKSLDLPVIGCSAAASH